MALIPELEFDATNVERIFYQNELILDYQAFPDIPIRYSRRQYDGLHEMHLSEPVWDPTMLDEELRRQREGIKNALLLPLCEEFITLLQQLQTFADSAAKGRWLARQTAKPSTSDWETADLFQEVQAVAGEGKKVGAEYWFHCPWHQDDTPSLHVHPEQRTWYAFCCNKGGGVTDWRKLTNPH